MNYYPFHIGDYASATRHLSWVEDAAYRRLLDVYYVREEPLPVDVRQVYRLVVASTDEQREAVDVVLGEFFKLTEDGYRHSRCDAEICATNDKKNKASQSALVRWSNARNEHAVLPSESERDTDAMRTHETTNANACETPCEGNAPNPNPNPNINNKNNASDVFKKQDESHLYVAPTRRIYSLFDEWKPEPELWKETLKRSAHLVKPEQFTKYTLLEFIRLNVGKDEKMESEWQKFYVNAIARGYIKPEGKESKPTNQPETAIDYTKPQNLIKPIIYEYDPEERARQSAEMKRIRKEQGR